MLQAFSRRYRVALFIVDIYRQRQFNNDISEVQELCSSVVRAGPRELSLDLPLLASRVDAIHVARLAVFSRVMSYLEPALTTASLKTVDFDDYESRTREAFCSLLRCTDKDRYLAEAVNAQRFRELEERAVLLFDRIYLSNDDDKRMLQKRFAADRFYYVPNCVSRTHVTVAPKPRGDILNTLLFVGTLDYLPNVDGLQYFCEQVLPLVRGMVTMPVTLLIVGARPDKRVHALAAKHGVTVVGEVASVYDYYKQDVVVIVPLRVGGGTSIKVLEAFASKRAVVSTQCGVRGLDVSHGVHVMIATSTRQFATYCATLLCDSVRREQLCERAFQFVVDNHDASQMRAYL
jgi:glycosyltransferase involved in cell wall biosynthesis